MWSSKLLEQKEAVIDYRLDLVQPINKNEMLWTNHETLFNLNIVRSFHPPFEPISAFLQLQALVKERSKLVLSEIPKTHCVCQSITQLLI